MIPYKHTCTSDILLCLFLYIPVVWFAMVLGQSYEESGLPVLLQNLTVALNNPLDIHWTKNSPAALLFATGIYGLCMGLYFTDRAKRRDGEEHGSATWGSPQQVNAMFVQRQNKPLTRHVKLDLDARKHKRNLNVLVIGGSGASKTRGYVKPNILEANTNYVITDPKQEVLTATGGFLRKQGYDVRVLNLVNLEQSDGYNPFVYLRDDKDVLRLVNTLIQATTPKGSHENDPFWTKSETALLMAIILMLFHEAPAYEQNFAMVMRTLEFAEVSEEDEEHISPLDMLFRALEQEQPNHIAVRQYRIFKQAAGKTAKSILVAAAVRLAAFNLPQIAKITSHDDMDLYSLGEKNALCMRSSRTTTTPFTSWYPFYMLRRSKLCTIQRIRFIMEPCLAMCTLFWTNLLPCRSPAIRENSPPCEAATYPAAPLFKILPKSKNFTKTPGRPS